MLLRSRCDMILCDLVRIKEFSEGFQRKADPRLRWWALVLLNRATFAENMSKNSTTITLQRRCVWHLPTISYNLHHNALSECFDLSV